jgi:NAD(P)-dependent dehydrogenase (short-subunit alcohol dehydrogenase family)
MPDGTLVVTGAASGIGKAVVEAARTAEQFERVVAVDRDLKRLQQLDAIVDHLVLAELDVTNPVRVEEVVTTSASAEFPYRGLVNSAGNHHAESSFEVAVEDWQKVIDVHLTGSFLVSRAVARSMAAASGGSIVNLSSIAQFFGFPARASYSAAKAGIAGLTRALAVEWADYGIRVNAVAPGYIDTPMGMQGVRDRAATERLHALNRFGLPSDVCEAICFLLSDRSSFITGEVLRVDGGYSIFKAAT